MAIGIKEVLDFSEWVHADKYRQEGETFADAMHRIANALSDSPEHYKQLHDILINRRFLPAGRVQSAVGSVREVTPYNCYVSRTIEDSREGIGTAWREAFETLASGGGIGYDFSTLRPKGALIKSLQSNSSGPVSFMDCFTTMCATVSSAGHRRGAQMGVMRVDHPDILEFINAKREPGRLWNFNISVGITNEFMEALEKGTTYTLRFEGKEYGELSAKRVWDTILHSTFMYNEPGVLFIDRMNEMNNLWYAETIAATNPCGEQPLPPFGACLLGSFCLPAYLEMYKGRYVFNAEQFIADIPVVVRAIDNVIDSALYPLPEQAVEAKEKRRMGLGVTGLSNTIETMGCSYGSKRFVEHTKAILTILRDESYRASVELAKEKGPFKLFDSEKYPQGKFIQTLPKDIQKDIKKYGIRNSHLTSIAPTGTISCTADNVSSGIEPVFATVYEREIIVDPPHGKQTFVVSDHAMRRFGVVPKIASECTTDDHVAVLCAAATLVDSAVSKTCNMPDEMDDFDAFKKVYMDAYKGGAKGCTTYIFRESNGMGSVLKAVSEEEDDGSVAACTYDPETGMRSCE